MLACLWMLPQEAARANLEEDPVQAHIDAVRIELAEGKVRLISDTMRLSDEEAEIFWPLYQEYEIELFGIGDRRLDLIERFVAAHQSKALDEVEAEKMIVDWFQQETDRLGLLKKYQRRIVNELSALRAIQFLQIEHRVNTVIDIMIASELPLFRPGEPQAAKKGLPEKKSQAVPIETAWQGDYPIDALKRLPAGQQEAATGYIEDAPTFTSVWRAFEPGEAVPQVDFEHDLVVFARNVHFYNRTRIVRVQITDGALQVLAAETMSAAPIEGEVAMALAVIPRTGVEAIRVGERRVSLLTPSARPDSQRSQHDPEELE
jgi:hypothetical protein